MKKSKQRSALRCDFSDQLTVLAFLRRVAVLATEKKPNPPSILCRSGIPGECDWAKPPKNSRTSPQISPGAIPTKRSDTFQGGAFVADASFLVAA